jgi:hypothetical protein
VFQEAYEHSVRYGIESIKLCWEQKLPNLAIPPQLKPRKDPRDTDFDLHINILSPEGEPEVGY